MTADQDPPDQGPHPERGDQPGDAEVVGDPTVGDLLGDGRVVGDPARGPDASDSSGQGPASDGPDDAGARDEGDGDDADGDDGGAEPRDGGAGPREGGARPRHEDGGDAGTRGSDEGSTELALAAPHGGPPRPPRRTGVFLDPEDLREHVGGLLRAILGGYEVDAFGNFTFTHEGARAFVTVGPSPIGPQVGVFSVTNLDLDLSPELGNFLLTTNHKLGFGAFSYDQQNRAVWLRHTLLGSTLDLPELQSAVAAIATTAAGLDERIRDRFGGRTFQEAPDDVQRRMEPPDATGDPQHPNARGYL